MSKAISYARTSASAMEMRDFLDDEALLEPIRKDYKKRHSIGPFVTPSGEYSKTERVLTEREVAEIREKRRKAEKQ